ncbi:MAG: helix-turn-helix domain-containing protein [Rikenellaceae bacterium]
MKKSILSDRAELLYVEELWTFEAIAAELGCSDRSVRNWAKDGRWEQKRKNFMAMQENISDDVRSIAQMLAKRIKTQLSDEMEPSPHVLNAFTRMASALLKAREYDREIEDEYNTQNTNNDNGARQHAAAKFKEVFGIDLQQRNGED